LARAVTNKLYRTFVKGLITEANELTYPENATTDEDNCIVFRKGNRSRRLGLDYSPSETLSSFTISSPTSVAIKEYVWETVAKDSSLNFVCVQIGTVLRFYDLAGSTVSGGKKTFEIDLTTFAAPSGLSVANTEIAMVGGRGYLFVAGEAIEPFLCDYNPDLGTLTTQRIYIQIRDFKGLDDGLANDEEPTSLTGAHRYNLRNQGWLDPSNTGAGSTVTYFDSFGARSSYTATTDNVIGLYYNRWSRYPANNKQWWIAKDPQTNAFDPSIFSTFYFGNNRSPRGHYIVEAFNQDRSAVSGVTGIAVETTKARPASIAFFAGRIWYVCGNSVYYSQVLDTKGKAGFCYTEGDPTAEDINEIIPTDGGVIQIPEMSKGVRLVPSGNGVVVFGLNGIWFVAGTQAGFTATDISISKISPLGVISATSVVEADTMIFWWSKVGIQGMSPKSGMFGPVEGVFDKTNITEQSIQTFYADKIPESRKPYAKGNYDQATNTVQWLYSSDVDAPLYSYNRVLNLDLTLQAFYPWSIDETVGPLLTGVFNTPKTNAVTHTAIRPTFSKYLCFHSVGSGNYKLTFGHFYNNQFVDWKTFNGTGVAYNSYIETGFELFEDAMRSKQTNVVYTYFRRTEENYVDDGNGDYTVDYPSSCMFRLKWDWSNSQASGKWTAPVEAYRFRRVLPFVDESDLTFDSGYPIVVSRHKVRGVGKALQFRFESDEIGKDFDLLGWAINVSGNTNP
jgi:hypothetical protein